MFLYGGKDADNLSSLPYVKCMKMVSNKFSQTRKIAPTKRVPYFHSLCVYYQVQKWNFLHKDSSNCNQLGLGTSGWNTEYWYQSWQMKHLPQIRYLTSFVAPVKSAQKVHVVEAIAPVTVIAFIVLQPVVTAKEQNFKTVANVKL